MLGIRTSPYYLPNLTILLALHSMFARSFALLPTRGASRVIARSSPQLCPPTAQIQLPCNRAMRFRSSHATKLSTASNDDLSLDHQGEAGTKSHRTYLMRRGKRVSFWHDVPLKNGVFYNFVCEIPKFTKAKMEVCKEEAGNPICQDLKKGELRFYDGPIYWNYGCMPQTWEDPDAHNKIPAKGDNDPLDVVEIGSAPLSTGSIVPVKVLGVLAMIDDGELDWKVVAINADDPMASRWNDIDDVDRHIVSGIREWFRWYKVPSGKPLNKFEFNELCLPATVALDVVKETHEHWRHLVSRKGKDGGKLWTEVAEPEKLK